MTEAFDRPAKESWQLVRFSNAITGSQFLAVTDRDSDYSYGGVDYTSETRLEVQPPENNGILSEQPCKIRLPLAAGFLTDITCGLPYYETKVEVIEVTKAEDASSTHNIVFSGTVVASQRNAGGRRNFVALIGLPIKSRIASATLGLPCMHHCINLFGGSMCKKNITGTPHRTNHTILSIDGSKVTVSGTLPTVGNHFYRKGFITLNGLSIMIQDWRNDVGDNPNEFFLYRRPPNDWLNALVSIFAGCDKTIESCRDVHNNEANFNGIGHHLPSYHPNYEDGGSRQ